MRIISIHVIYKQKEKPIFLKSSYKLDFVSILKRRFVKETLNFGARTVASKTKADEYIKVEMQEMENTVVISHVDR